MMNQEFAFPHENRHTHKITGMTLRDYFAAKALPSIINDWYNDGLKVGDHGGADGVAMCAYMVADAMMEARKE
jgi:hypothetical protein